jgi:hypothetical protein
MSTPAAVEVILPGQLDLPVLPGTRLLTPCAGWFAAEPIAPPKAQCVVLGPSGESLRFQQGYAVALRAAGWSDAGGAANVLWFDRPIGAPGCRQRLNLIGVASRLNAAGTDFDLTSDVIFIFGLEQNPICPDKPQ